MAPWYTPGSATPGPCGLRAYREIGPYTTVNPDLIDYFTGLDRKGVN